ncbi:MAG TPA: amidohydrolase family protein [Phycicoccus sp.]|jgi:imidazolonepropionase-like amidohydrolase|nr:amidohydrolase family protein [Phycicoccus sp.]HQH06985.1 amidohydrolase family protein [Phycicoccus sp.]HQK31723.1 amidohydrolase family protein [Phycicoccus sp.]HQV90642.1 amidohydrolase family protein [Phycicoccus sp.]HQY96579.1 amidohydrolase family protein [Phycicoccus sp.]
MATVLHLTGPILVSTEDVRDEAWVIDGRLTFERPGGSGHEVATLAGWVLPGLVDAHCHVGLGDQGEVPRDVAEEQARTDRDHGTLLIRDAGQPGDTRWIDERDDLPKVIRAGRHIARTRRYIRNYAWEVEPEQLVERVRIEARVGDGWVKLVGDWIDRDTGDLEPCWPVDVLTAAIAVAHEEGARVTAHCFGEQSLRDFAVAGTDCIEHATGLLPDTIETFAAQGIAIVPTLVNIETFPSIAEAAEGKFAGYAAHMRDLHARRYETIGAAFEAGVPIFAGTDAGGTIAHGLIPQEAAELAKAGMPSAAVLDAVTWGARAWLGRPGLEEGADADLLVLPRDPRSDLTVLHEPTAIVLRGQRF